MYSFRNDYSETAHPSILKALMDTNMEQLLGYGMDEHCQNAIRYMKEKMQAENVDIHFISGGTQTNLLATAAFLRPYEGVISADTGHINSHEAGSVEATGHKILAEPTPDGKLTVANLQHAVAANSEEHTPRPKMVYISNSTELGTVYSKAELQALYAFCKERDIYLFIDGARMGSALAVKQAGLRLDDYPRLCDAFYIGGTKNGALMGEAMVIVNDALKEGFRWHMKQRGATLAKGKVLGVQFEELFRDDLFMQLAYHANAMSDILREGITKLGYSFLADSPSNQIFPIFPDDVLEEMEKEYADSYWLNMGEGYSCVRLVTSWATDEKAVRAYLAKLASLTK